MKGRDLEGLSLMPAQCGAMIALNDAWEVVAIKRDDLFSSVDNQRLDHSEGWLGSAAVGLISFGREAKCELSASKMQTPIGPRAWTTPLQV